MDFDFNSRRRPARLAVVPVPVDETNSSQTFTPVPEFSDAPGASRLPLYGMDDYAPDTTRSAFADTKDTSGSADSDTSDVSPDNSDTSGAGDSDNGSNSSDSGDTPTPDPSRKQRLFAGITSFVKSHPRWSIAGGLVLLLLASGYGAYVYTGYHRKPVPNTPVAAAKKKPAAPVPITSPLTGLVVSAEQSKRPVTGVMIENTTFARPQSGLKDAGVVFEAIAEAGITRFLALFQDNQPGNVGPIRSARPYYVDWAHSFDAPLAHVGGSPDALNKIKSEGTKDLDQFYNAGSYHRISSREAPHNVYTSIATLNDLESKKGWTSSSFTGFPRKKEAPAKTPTAKTIDFNISGPTYNAHYDYDAANNQYLRSEGGAPHKDAESGAQLAPKVVVALVIPYSLMSDGYHSQYQITGSGEAMVFQDGTVTKGTWTRKDGASQYQFTDEQHKVIKLNAGQTWISAVSSAGSIAYKP